MAVPAQAAGPVPTTTVVTASASPVIVDTPVTLTAKVSVAGLGGLVVTPTGTVTFTTGATNLGSATLSAPTSCVLTACSASLTTSALPVGTDLVTATYSGDTAAEASSGTTTVQVNPPPNTAPCAPTLSATSQIGSIKLDWASACTGGTPITRYALYRSLASSGPYAQIASGLPSGTYQDTTGVIGTTYYFRATTSNAIGESAQSNTASSASTSNGDSSTFSTTQCAAGSPCSSPTTKLLDGNGDATSIQVTTAASASSHTLTTANGGPNLTGCSIPGAGPGGTFNDTSTDARKTVTWITRGYLVESTSTNYHPADGFSGCLGLGHPWFAGSLSNPAVWVPADGLYEATTPLCENNGAFYVSPGVYSQPCTYVTRKQTGPQSTHVYRIEYNLPPGDGRIGGGR